MSFLPNGFDLLNTFIMPDRAPSGGVSANRLTSHEDRELAAGIESRLNVLRESIPRVLAQESLEAELAFSPQDFASEAVQPQLVTAAPVAPAVSRVSVAAETATDFLDGFDERVQWDGSRATDIPTADELAARQAQQAAQEQEAARQAAQELQYPGVDPYLATTANEIDASGPDQQQAYIRELAARRAIEQAYGEAA